MRLAVRRTRQLASALSTEAKPNDWGNWLDPPPLSPPSGNPEDLYRTIPRRPQLSTGASARLAPAMMTEVRFQTTTLRLIGRLLLWLLGTLRFVMGCFIDIVLFRRDWRTRRWVRLRLAFESLGGTFIKVGQQLSMRVDLLPIELCDELAKLLDKVPPFDVEFAKKRIEAAVKAPLAEVFSTFDPNPVGSASVSCVYQAVLMTGERVAVKVRRPQIGEIFAADLRALGFLLWIFELFTVVRDGFFKHLRTDLSTMLMEELDFRVEARHQELFRRAIRKARLRYLDAPRVFFALSSEDVLVSDFINGVWLSELLTAVESADTETLQRIQELNISPKTVSHRLMVASLFSIYDGTIFHADPHPANILVQPNNHLVLIDFGSCGAYSDRERHLMQQLHYHIARMAPAAMVQVALAMQEPLPPVDISELTKKLELAWWRQLMAMKSKDAKWWERTSAGLWLNIMAAIREYNIPVNLGMLKGIRSTMLYDTIAARLNPKMNGIRVIARYGNSWQKRQRRVAARKLKHSRQKFSIKNMVRDGYIAMEGVQDLVTQSRFRLQRILDSTNFNFTDQIAKASFLGLMIIRLNITLVGVTAAWAAATFLNRHLTLHPISFMETGKAVLESRAYWAVIAGLVFRAVRQVQFRFADKETD